MKTLHSWHGMLAAEADERPMAGLAWLVIWTRHRFCVSGCHWCKKPTKIWHGHMTWTRLQRGRFPVGPDVSPEFGSWLQLAEAEWRRFLRDSRGPHKVMTFPASLSCFQLDTVYNGFTQTSWSQWWLAGLLASGNHFDFAVGLGCYFRMRRSFGTIWQLKS